MMKGIGMVGRGRTRASLRDLVWVPLMVKVRFFRPRRPVMVELQVFNPGGGGCEVAGDGADCRFHFHSSDAQSVLALSQLVQPSSKMVQYGVVLRLGERYSSAPIVVRLFGDHADFPSGCCFQCVTAVVAMIFNRARTRCGRHFSIDRGAP